VNRPNTILKAALLASTALALVGAAPSALATDWTGAVSNDWANGANWSGGTPTSGDDAVLDVTSPNAPNIAGGITANTAQLFIGQSATGALTVLNGSLGTNGQLSLGYAAGASGTLSATGSGSQIGVNGNLQVGYNGTGAVSLSQ
jgi:T5SS/PEP-CTERM-associated repeat protein